MKDEISVYANVEKIHCYSTVNNDYIFWCMGLKDGFLFRFIYSSDFVKVFRTNILLLLPKKGGETNKSYTKIRLRESFVHAC